MANENLEPDKPSKFNKTDKQSSSNENIVMDHLSSKGHHLFSLSHPASDANPSFAPLRLPLRRRLQTLAVYLHTCILTYSTALFTLLWCRKEFWPFLIIYVLYIYFDRNSTFGWDHHLPCFRNSKVWRWYCQYFPIEINRMEELDPNRNYIFGYHPHGIIAMGAFGAFCTEGAGFSKLFPKIKLSLATLTTGFKVPFYRDWMKFLGVCPVSRSACKRILDSGPGYSVMIVVGGASESLLAKPGEINLVIKKRKGFAKLALETGSDLVPCIAFGENDIYFQIDNDPTSKLYRAQVFMKRILSFTLPLFHGRGALNYDVGLLPRRCPINIVVGRPIKVEKVLDPSQTEISELHRKYVDSIQQIWDEFKDVYASNRVAELQLL